MGRTFIGIFAALFTVIFIAVVGAQDEECGEKKSGECVERLLTAIMQDISEEEACVEMYEVANCLRNVADECLGEDRDPKIDESLEELDNLLAQNCPAPERDEDEVDKCVDENKEYLLECISKSMTEVTEFFEDADELDMDLMKCTLYGMMTECIVDRASEKCGEAARKKATEQMADMPPTVVAACSAQSSLDFFSTQFLDRRKK